MDEGGVGSYDYKVKVVSDFGGINLRVKNSDGEELINGYLGNGKGLCLDSSLLSEDLTDSGSNTGSITASTCEGSVSGDSREDMDKNSLGTSKVADIYDDAKQKVGWLWDLKSYGLPKLYISFDGTVTLDKVYLKKDHPVMRLKANQINIANINATSLQLSAAKVSFYDYNHIDDLAIDGCVTVLEKDSTLKVNHGNFFTSLDNQGSINAKNLTIKSHEFSNSGDFYADDLQAEVQDFTNSGEVSSCNLDLLTHHSFSNSKVIDSSTMDLVNHGTFAQYGLIKGNEINLITPEDLVNYGKIQSDQQLSIKAKNFINYDNLVAERRVNLDLGTNGTFTNQAKGFSLLYYLNSPAPIKIINHGQGIKDLDSKKLTKDNKKVYNSSVDNGAIEFGLLCYEKTRISSIDNSGYISFIKGDLQLDQLTNRGQVVLGSGTKEIDYLENHPQAIIDLGTETIVGRLKNQGYLRSDATEKFNINGEFADGLGTVIATSETVWQMPTHSNGGAQLSKSVFLSPHLIINHDRFTNHHKLIFNAPVTINSKIFINYGEISSQDLNIYADSIINGVKNEQLGLIAADQLTLTIKEQLDNRYGRIFSQSHHKIKANKVLVGAPKSVSTPHPQRVFGGANTLHSTHYEQACLNGAYIASSEDLEIIADNEIIVDFGEIYSDKNLTLAGKNLLKNKGGAIRSRGNMQLLGKKYWALRTEGLAGFGSTSCNPNYTNIVYYLEYAKAAQTNAYLDLFFGVDVVVNHASEITAGGSIYHQGKLRANEKQAFTSDDNQVRQNYSGKHLSRIIANDPLANNTAPCFISLGRNTYYSEVEGGRTSYTHCDRTPVTPASVMAGNTLSIKGSDGVYLVNSQLNALVIDIDVVSLLSKITGTRHDSDHAHHLIIDLSKVAKNLVGGFFQALDHGQVKTALPLKPDPKLTKTLSKTAIIGTNNRTSESSLDQASFIFALQQALSKYVGQLHLDGKSGEQLVNYLAQNSIVQGKKRYQDIHEFVKHISKPALATIYNETKGILQHTQHLIVPPKFINPYQSIGDISGKNIKMLTSGDQTHSSTRIVAENNVFLYSGGQINRSNETYDAAYYKGDGSYQQAIYGQHLIYGGNDVTLISRGSYSETGVLTKSGNNLTRGSTHGNTTLQSQTLTNTQVSKGRRNTNISTTVTFVPNQAYAGNNSTIIGNNLTMTGVKEGAKEYLTFQIKDQIKANAAVGYNSVTNNTTNTTWSGSRTTTTSSSSIPVFLANDFYGKKIWLHSNQSEINGSNWYGHTLYDHTYQGTKFGSTIGTFTSSTSTNIKNPTSSHSSWSNSYKQVESKSTFTNLGKVVITPNDNPNKTATFTNMVFNPQQIEGNYQQVTQTLLSGSNSGASSSGLGSSQWVQVISLAAAIAMQQYQVGASFFTALGASSTVTSMGVAALATLASQAAANLAATGDLSTTMQNLTSNRSLRQVAISAVSSGVLQGIKDTGINLDSSGSLSLVDHLKTSTIKTMVNTSVNMVISKDDSKDILHKNLHGLGADIAIGYGAQQIGAWYGGTEKTPPTIAFHKVLHGLNSGILGHVIGQRDLYSSAMGAMVGASVIEARNAYIEEKLDEINHKYNGLKSEQLIKELDKSLQSDLALAQISSASVAALFKADPEAAAWSAQLTGSNNCIPLLMSYLLACAGTLTVYYQAMDIYQEKNLWAALNYLSKEGAVILALSSTTGAPSIVKVSEQAFKIGGKLYTNAHDALKALRQFPIFNKAYKQSIKGNNPIIGSNPKNVVLHQKYKTDLRKQELFDAKQMYSDKQLHEVLNGKKPIIIAGNGSKEVLDVAPKLVKKYGGKAEDWSKITSKNYKQEVGKKFEIHAYRNAKTGQVVEAKTKLID